MLITTCAHCKARFRVTPQQLNAKQGQVRCGRCAQVFNGFQILERFPDDDTGGRLLAEQDARRIAEGTGPPPSPTAVDLPIFEEAPPAAVDPLHATDPPAPAEPAPAAADAPAEEATRRPRRTHHVDPALTLQVDPPPPPARAWRFGVAFLAMVLALELAYGYRAALAQNYPSLRPPMESLCARLGCTVPWSRQEALLKLEDSELLEVPGKPGEIALGARIRNLAPVAQEYPHLELTLTDVTGQAAVRRVLRPTDFLGRPLAHGEVLAPGMEVALQLRLETPTLKATGYELLVFYP
jgi:predicted Zn finger-like uncharacterized protein